eukprot:TRINITY_DN18744_c0_g2_i2.p2 TRINITY_DN18744_c0_g2~~TRINITY_DN18744_c0_g2_i2.p2  ORF type:complete len:207 (+),score=-6.78 TRINITY_DN18744_c0_g2_i2:125-745(+)
MPSHPKSGHCSNKSITKSITKLSKPEAGSGQLIRNYSVQQAIPIIIISFCRPIQLPNNKFLLLFISLTTINTRHTYHACIHTKITSDSQNQCFCFVFTTNFNFLNAICWLQRRMNADRWNVIIAKYNTIQTHTQNTVQKKSTMQKNITKHWNYINCITQRKPVENFLLIQIINIALDFDQCSIPESVHIYLYLPVNALFLKAMIVT